MTEKGASKTSCTDSLGDTDINKETNTQELQAQKDLSIIREIINAQALEKAKAEQLCDARNYVSNVFSEALLDRQQRDKSVGKLLVPIVEDALQASVINQRHQITDYLYPLVGELFRKFSIAFLRDFIEKTNELIESSLTPKSILWRFRAWRSGLSYKQYVASQVYTFQVHQVLLIHKETGVLLNTQSAQPHIEDDSDLVSAMLSAINDFINDSFANNTQLNAPASVSGEKHSPTNRASLGLDEIKTDKFTLYVKQAPKALLVAAVTGNISPEAKDKLQATLEQIHSVYLSQLQSFKGDISHFDNTSVYLRECLIQEEKKIEKARKTPWFALIIFILSMLALSYYAYLSWQTNAVENQLYTLPMDQGIAINSTQVTGLRNIDVSIFRDPSAISVNEWLNMHSQQSINKDWLQITETPYSSLAPAIVQRQIQTFVEVFNAQQDAQSNSFISFDIKTNTLSGELSSAQKIAFDSQVYGIKGIEQIALNNNIKSSLSPSNQSQIAERAITLLSGEIAALQVDFGLASAEVKTSERNKLALIYEKYQQIKAFSGIQNRSAKLLILGASDNVGNRNVNEALSIERAQNTADALIAIGLKKNDLMTSGLGIIADAPEGTNVRKAIVHVLLNDK